MGQRRDFRTAAESDLEWVPTAKDAQGWGDDRTVRGAFVRHLVVDDGLSVNLVGARIAGELDLRNRIVELAFNRCIFAGDAVFDGAMFTGDADFDEATFTGDASFNEATFTGDARFVDTTFTGVAGFVEATFRGNAGFYRATFTEDAWFDEATFTGDADFDEATFTGDADFNEATFTGDADFNDATFTGVATFPRSMFNGDAGFYRATFTRNAWLHEAKFAGDADFNEAIFTEDARFDEATFTGDASFHQATFTGNAWFLEATFTGDASFHQATFTGNAWFPRATFTGDTGWFLLATFTGVAGFSRATFTRTAWFREAKFAGRAEFDGVCCGGLELSSTVWEKTVNFEGLCAVNVRADGSVFREAVRLDITAEQLSAVRLRAEKQIHLVVAGARVDLTDADLAADSLIEAVPVPTARGKDGRRVEPTRPGSLDTVEWLDIQIARNKLSQTLAKALPPSAAASITSLQRARVAGTTISGMSLRDCSFSDVHELDALRIADVQVLRSSKEKNPGWALPARLRSKRRLIVDELDVRGVKTDLSSTTSLLRLPPEIRQPTDPLPTARAAAGAYRAMRKGLEDSKDEPGAADFYYGEMEMRRRAAGRVSAERALLTLYWFISGYGLRAWRALTCLVGVIAIAGWCFTNSNWVRPSTASSATTPLVDPDSVAWPWLFAGGETISLFRPTGAAGVTLVGFGTVVDLAIRVLGPVLLALALLAVRNRTKR